MFGTSKFERKEKNLKSNFVFNFWFGKSQKEKMERKNTRKTWAVMEKKKCSKYERK